MILFTKRLYLLIFVSLIGFSNNLFAHGDEGGFPVICPQDVTVDCLTYTWDPADIPILSQTLLGRQIIQSMAAMRMSRLKIFQLLIIDLGYPIILLLVVPCMHGHIKTGFSHLQLAVARKY